MNKPSNAFFESEITEIDKSDFKKFIDKQRERMKGEIGYDYTRRKYYPLDLIAKNLGMSREMLQKRINKQKPTSKRDFVIALCAVLGCNSDETNTAMRLYDYMPAFDTENGRDDCIIDFLEEHAGEISNIEDINTFLVNRNYQELNIIDHRTNRKNEKNQTYIDRTKLSKKLCVFFMMKEINMILLKPPMTFVINVVSFLCLKKVRKIMLFLKLGLMEN